LQGVSQASRASNKKSGPGTGLQTADWQIVLPASWNVEDDSGCCRARSGGSLCRQRLRGVLIEWVPPNGRCGGTEGGPWRWRVPEQTRALGHRTSKQGARLEEKRWAGIGPSASCSRTLARRTDHGSIVLGSIPMANAKTGFKRQLQMAEIGFQINPSD
jgi:hypothetical protein